MQLIKKLQGSERSPPFGQGLGQGLRHWRQSVPYPAMGVSQIKMPQLGESVTEGTVDKWLKHEGDFVKRDEPLVEVVTDKVNAEIPSPFEGKLVKIAVSEGETVRVGVVIAQIETATAAAAPAKAPAKEREAAVADSEVPPEATAGRAPAPTATSVSPPAETSDGERT